MLGSRKHQPRLAPGGSRHRPLQPAPDLSSGARKCSCTTRSRASGPARRTRFGWRSKRQGGGGGIFKKIFGGGGAALSLKFDAQGQPTLESAHRGLQLDRLKPGNYVLEVTVTDGEGRKDQRHRPFQVVDGVATG